MAIIKKNFNNGLHLKIISNYNISNYLYKTINSNIINTNFDSFELNLNIVYSKIIPVYIILK